MLNTKCLVKRTIKKNLLTFLFQIILTSSFIILGSSRGGSREAGGVTLGVLGVCSFKGPCSELSKKRGKHRACVCIHMQRLSIYPSIYSPTPIQIFLTYTLWMLTCIISYLPSLYVLLFAYNLSFSFHGWLTLTIIRVGSLAIPAFRWAAPGGLKSRIDRRSIYTISY